MSSFLTEVKGFTPLIEVMVQEVGLVQAAVYGVVWRYCQRREGICTASHQTLADALGLSRGTVQRHIKELCEAGYLRDTTPDRKNRPHVYADTGRALICGLMEAKVAVPESDTTLSENDSPLYQKDTRGECESTKETLVADATKVEPAGEELVDEYFGARKTPKQEPVESTGDWRGRLKDNPHLAWAADCDEAQAQLQREDKRGNPMRILGYGLDTGFGLRPVWAKKKDVRGWFRGLAACLDVADDDAELVLTAARQLLEGEMTVSDPWSLVKKTRALAAEQRRPQATSGAFFIGV